MTTHVLVIEDNAANLELMRYLLDAFGFLVTSCTSGEDGVEAARRRPPDLIICDIQLPRMSGADVARELKADARLKSVPLIAVTAFAMLGDRERLLRAGFDGYISKPIDPAAFAGQIAACLPSAAHSAADRRSIAGSRTLDRMPLKELTILAVDNLQSNLDFVSTMLGHMGYTVLTAGSAEEALRVARQVVPDLIMSDVCMPVSSGFEFIASVKGDERLRGIPFVFITSTALDASDRQRALDLGAARYIVRPIEPEALLLEVEACLRWPGRP